MEEKSKKEALSKQQINKHVCVRACVRVNLIVRAYVNLLG